MNKLEFPVISGLYPRVDSDGNYIYPEKTILEIGLSLKINPHYRELLLTFAADREMAKILDSFGLTVVRTFEDAPHDIWRAPAHRMKHYFCYYALKRWGGFLWLDWDTVQLRALDGEFWEWCRYLNTPKFIFIPNYWAIVNCGVFFAPSNWLEEMEESFSIPEKNDELLWAGVLPSDILERPEFWWEDRAINIWDNSEWENITDNTYFIHIKELSLFEEKGIKRAL